VHCDVRLNVERPNVERLNVEVPKSLSKLLKPKMPTITLSQQKHPSYLSRHKRAPSLSKDKRSLIIPHKPHKKQK
jgi:hypothetical protein